MHENFFIDISGIFFPSTSYPLVSKYTKNGFIGDFFDWLHCYQSELVLSRRYRGLVSAGAATEFSYHGAAQDRVHAGLITLPSGF